MLERLTSKTYNYRGIISSTKKNNKKNEKKGIRPEKRRTGLLGGNPPSGMGAHIL